MNVVFRTDASLDIGNGHVMRCLTLADNLSKNNSICHFICKDLDSNLIEIIKNKGYLVFPIKPDPIPINIKEPIEMYENWLGSSQSNDAYNSISYIKDIQPDWVIIDNYAIDTSWEKLVGPHCKNMLVIDDLANRNHVCDILVDQTFRQTKDHYAGKVNDKCLVLCGSKYSLLRPEFREWRLKTKNKSLNKNFLNILVNLGGIDKGNVTSKVIDALNEVKLPLKIKITIIMGPYAPHINLIKKKLKLLKHEVELQIGITNMAEVMSINDICIGAAGSTSWERCCLGLPSITLVIAENQKIISKNLEDSGITISLNINDIQSSLESAIIKLINNWDLYRQSSLDIVDGLGAERVIKAMYSNMKATYT
jgi:UDP-2,4-diacetamido-2,4,6-trideoxy-beta-L-altropyranose hydrolase